MVRTRSSRSRARNRSHPIVSEARVALRRSVSPVCLPTSRDLTDRLPLLARVLGKHGAQAGLREADGRALLELYAAKLVELKLRERLVAAVGPATAPAAVA